SAICSTCNMVIVHDASSFLCALALETHSGFAVSYEGFWPCFATSTFSVHTDPSGCCGFSLVRSDGITLGNPVHYVLLAYSDSNESTPADPRRFSTARSVGSGISCPSASLIVLPRYFSKPKVSPDSRYL